jgi:OmcA/MtrC family decaheme c-type cytochrome
VVKAGQLITVDAAKGIYAVDYATYLGYVTSGGKPRVLPGTNSAFYTSGNAIVGFAVQATRSDLTVKRRGVTTVRPLGATVTPVYYDLKTGFQTTDSSAVRRNVVDTAKCNNCHGGLVGFHSAGRANVEYCGFCHTPNNAVAADGTTTPATPEAAGDIKVFVHKIHRGSALADTTYNFETALADGYPNDLRRCNACHISDNPTVTSTYDTIVSGTNRALTLPDWSATCTSCHDGTTGTVAGSTTGPVGHAAANNPNNCVNCHNDSFRSTGHQPSR